MAASIQETNKLESVLVWYEKYLVEITSPPFGELEKRDITQEELLAAMKKAHDLVIARIRE